MKELPSQESYEAKTQKTIHPFFKNLVSSSSQPVIYFPSTKVQNNPFHSSSHESSSQQIQLLTTALQSQSYYYEHKCS